MRKCLLEVTLSEVCHYSDEAMNAKIAESEQAETCTNGCCAMCCSDPVIGVFAQLQLQSLNFHITVSEAQSTLLAMCSVHPKCDSWV